MRDVSQKISSLRTAQAQAILRMGEAGVQAIRSGTAPKGDPFAVAQVAAIQAAKNTSQLIPYCHPVPLDHVQVDFAVEGHRVLVRVSVKAIHRTGVEMEALTGAAVAALTVYDMLKIIDQDLAVESIELIEKHGGKSDFTEVLKEPKRAAVVVLSDSIAAGKKEDASGRMIVERLRELGLEVAEYRILPDDKDQLVALVKRYADHDHVDLVVTTGGTGLSDRDVTPEAMEELLAREVPGIAEAARSYGLSRTPYAMLSRGRSGVRGRTLIVNLPGSRRGVEESLDALFPWLFHGFSMIEGRGHGKEGYGKGEQR